MAPPFGVTAVSTRSYFSTAYLWSADHHARLASELEESYAQGGEWRHWPLRAYVLSAVTDSVAFVEAAVNEVLQDVADDHNSYIEPLSASQRVSLKGYWLGAATSRTLTKYEDTLSLCGAPAMTRGAAPWQDMAVLVSLRNELVHYKPTDASDAFDPPRLARALRGKFADAGLFAKSGNAWFPDKALGAGCATWASVTARGFVDEWTSRLGLTLNYQRVGLEEAP